MNFHLWKHRYFWRGLFRYHLLGRHRPGLVCLACVPPADIRLVARLTLDALNPPDIPPLRATDYRWPNEPCGKTIEECPFDKVQHFEFERYLAFLKAIEARMAEPLGYVDAEARVPCLGCGQPIVPANRFVGTGKGRYHPECL